MVDNTATSNDEGQNANSSIVTEMWLGYPIRFIEKEPGEWWAVLADITDALELTAKGVKQRLDDEVISNYPIPDAMGRDQTMLIVNEEGIYDAVFRSHKKETREFRRWVYRLLKHLRQQSGIEGFQVFRMLDRAHQREAMKRLSDGLDEATERDYIKANMIANKTVATMHGLPRAVKKDEMSPQMLTERQQILDETVELMGLTKKFNLPISVSEMIYSKHPKAN